MAKIDLKYGRSLIPFEYDEEGFEVLAGASSEQPLSDIEIGQKLDAPMGSERIEEIVNPGATVLLVVPDATRETACGQVVNLLVRRLIANGTAVSDISIIFATGIHRRVTETEKQQLLTPFIAQRIKTIDHDAGNPLKIFRVGVTSGGIPVELNWTLTEFDHVVLIGGVSFHYFAGFTGGRKLVCPGLASSRTISETHKLAFDCEARSRRAGVGTGLLDGNTVHEAFMEGTALVNPSFAINTIVSDAGEAVDLFCGDWKASHRAACEAYAAKHTTQIREKRPFVIASCGGYPHDINMIQAHKTLEAASHACTEGGTIILLAECEDGLGRSDFLEWFAVADSDALAANLCERYQVNGQTAWSLLKKAEKFDVRILTSLDEERTRKMRMTKIEDLPEVVADKAYILPSGARQRITIS
jgi:nickel-dependent lactate racemase